MSDTPTITLDFIAKQQARLLDEMAGFRDDLIVLGAVTARVETSVATLITEVRELEAEG